VAACDTAWAAADAQTSDPFEYKLEVTPEEGPVDDVIESRYSKLFADCQERAQVTQENAACFEAEFIRQDAALNKAWKAALGRLPAATHTPLLAAQRKWIAARDPFCRADAAGGGTIAPVEYVSCRVELTIRRTIWLEHLH
jgi:uncharacterized protein YecT (DUF1311 family)